MELRETFVFVCLKEQNTTKYRSVTLLFDLLLV